MLLDDLVPGTYTRFPVQKMTKLFENEYFAWKFEEERKEMLKEFDFMQDEGGQKRKEELKKAAVEIERSNLIN